MTQEDVEFVLRTQENQMRILGKNPFAEDFYYQMTHHLQGSQEYPVHTPLYEVVTGPQFPRKEHNYHPHILFSFFFTFLQIIKMQYLLI
jgi:hypothetical protein